MSRMMLSLDTMMGAVQEAWGAVSADLRGGRTGTREVTGVVVKCIDRRRQSGGGAKGVKLIKVQRNSKG